jgi:hypothetical protein
MGKLAFVAVPALANFDPVLAELCLKLALISLKPLTIHLVASFIEHLMGLGKVVNLSSGIYQGILNIEGGFLHVTFVFPIQLVTWFFILV